MSSAIQEHEWDHHMDPRAVASAKKKGRSKSRPMRVLIIGSGAIAEALAETLQVESGYEVIGFADDSPVGKEEKSHAKLLGHRDSVLDLIQRHQIDEIFIADAPTWQQRLLEDLSVYHPEVAFKVVPSVYETMIHPSRVENFGDIALLHLKSIGNHHRERMKRLFDIVSAGSGLIILSPLMLLVFLLLKWKTSGSVIFAQERTGRFGKPFTLFKFRTMIPDAEAETGPVLTNGNADPRLTPIGRWLKQTRLDEIPQLWNVLKGEMSLVGPRPERPYFVEMYERSIPAYTQRHRVRPGITGLAQVRAGYSTTAQDKLRFDLLYASHCSFWMDVSILLQTFKVIFRPR